MVGDHDIVFAADVRAMALVMPRATFLELPNSGHAEFIDDPKGFVGNFSQWMQSVLADSGDTMYVSDYEDSHITRNLWAAPWQIILLLVAISSPVALCCLRVGHTRSHASGQSRKARSEPLIG